MILKNPELVLYFVSHWLIWGAAGGNASSAAVLDCPGVCFCDDHTALVSCNGDGWPDFPEPLPADVERLDLRHFQLGTLNGADMQLYPFLREFSAQHCHLQLLANESLARNSRLERLDLSQNQLKTVTQGMLTGLVRLRSLDLASNQLTSLDGAFLDLAALEQLNLRDNVLQQLHDATFQGLSRLQYLNLDSNKISSIDPGTFQSLTGLAHLLLSNNPLVTWIKLDFFGARLQYVDLSHAGLTHVPQSLTRFVRDLRLPGNNISGLGRGDLESYPYLRLLVLDDNGLSSVEEDALGRLDYLQRLWLSDNQLGSVPQTLPSALRSLHLSGNQLSLLQAADLTGVPDLEELLLARNQIAGLQLGALHDIPKLKILELQANRLDKIEVMDLDQLPNLETLDLSNNPIRLIQSNSLGRLKNLKVLRLAKIPSIVTETQLEIDDQLLAPLQNLQILDLHSSPQLAARIFSSPRGLQTLPATLRELDLTQCALRTLWPSLSSSLPQLRLARLTENLWDCSLPGVAQLRLWMRAGTVEFAKAYNVRCVRPESLAEKPVVLLDEAELLNTTTLTSLVSPTTTTLQSKPSISTIFLTFPARITESRAPQAAYRPVTGIWLPPPSTTPLTFVRPSDQEQDDFVEDLTPEEERPVYILGIALLVLACVTIVSVLIVLAWLRQAKPAKKCVLKRVKRNCWPNTPKVIWPVDQTTSAGRFGHKDPQRHALMLDKNDELYPASICDYRDSERLLLALYKNENEKDLFQPLSLA